MGDLQKQRRHGCKNQVRREPVGKNIHSVFADNSAQNRAGNDMVTKITERDYIQEGTDAQPVQGTFFTPVLQSVQNKHKQQQIRRLPRRKSHEPVILNRKKDKVEEQKNKYTHHFLPPWDDLYSGSFPSCFRKSANPA